MPPEPFPWDRKGFFRDRKYSRERPSESSLEPVSRWRDSASHGSRNYFARWGFVPEFRRPPGHGRQGGWHPYPEEAPHGYPISRSGGRFLEDDGYRPFGHHRDGRNMRIYRDRASFTHKDWRGHSLDNDHHHCVPPNAPALENNRHHFVPPNAPAKLPDVNDHRSVSHMSPCSSPPHPDSLNISNQHHSKDQAEKPIDVNGLGIGQRVDKENSFGIDWKLLKWSRYGSLTSRGSGFSHSSSSRSIGGDSSYTRGELIPQNTTHVESPSGDSFVCTISAASLEETFSINKPRLGWGEGLAKYEKKKVEGPEENANNIENATCANYVELPHSLASNIGSPRVLGFSDCSSPATPSSVSCSSSPGLEDKPSSRATVVDNDANNLCVSPTHGSQIQVEGSSFNVENFECGSITNLSAFLSEVLQSEYQSMVTSGFTESLALNKLLLWKRDIMKALELTESEVDSLENELKLLRPESDRASQRPASSSSLFVSCKEQPCKLFNMSPRPPLLGVASSGDVVEEGAPCGYAIEETLAEVKGKEMDSPGTATSKIVEPLSSKKLESPVDQKDFGSKYIVDVESTALEANTSVSSSDRERTTGSSGDSTMMIPGSITSGHGDGCLSIEHGAYDNIRASNQETAAKASEVFQLLPISDYNMEIVDEIRASSRENELLIRKKLLRRKRFLRFKERVIYLRYRAFHNLWKKDLLLLSIRKCVKSQKKLEMTSGILHSGSQKHRFFNRSRFASAGSLTLVPTTEIIALASKLLSDCQTKCYRDSLKMPALILDERDKLRSSFLSSNGLVEDPCAFEKDRSLINPWIPEEKEIFMDKLATFGKDFRRIASFLDHKTTADCIEFYYKNHKLDCFEKTKKKTEFKKQEKSISTNTYLVTSGKRLNREIDAVSLDLLGAASAIAAHAEEGMELVEVFPGRLSENKSGGTDGISEGSSSYYVEDEREAAAADVLAGICGSLSSEALSSCTTSPVDPLEACQEWKCQKVHLSTGQLIMTEVTQNVDDDSCSDESCSEMDQVDWTDEERSSFVQAFSSYGKDFVMISQQVQTKSRDQCKVFFSKLWKCLGLDMICPDPGNTGTLQGDDANGGGSDTEGACVVEALSIVCSDKSGSRMDEDLLMSISDKKHLVSKHEAMNLPAGMNMSAEDCYPELKLEKLPPGNHLADCTYEMTLDGEFQVNCEDKMPVRMQDQEKSVVSGAPGCQEEQSAWHNAPIMEAVAEVLGAAPDHKIADDVASGKPIFELQNKDVSNRDVPSAVNDLGGTRDEGNNESASTDFNQSFSCQALQNQDESLNMRRGYPLDLSIYSELNGNISQKLHSAVESVSRTETSVQSFQGGCLKKCSGTSSQNSICELNFFSRSKGPSEEAGVNVPYLSDREQPCGNGDVKLFGKFLTKPSSLEKQLSTVRENDHKGIAHHPGSVSILDMKVPTNHSTDGKSSFPKHDDANFLGLKNIPMSYGFWDGVRIQTGYPPSLDSDILLAKYPAPFSGYSLPSSKMEQRSMDSNGCHLKGGASVFPSDSSCSINQAVANYQIHGSQDGVQPFRLVIRQGQDTLSKLQRHGFQAVSSSKQQDSCRTSGISDPLAAHKLHHAKTHTAAPGAAIAAGVMGNGNVIPDAAWKGQADVQR
ncbi:hypothetical protein Nepgr_012373 [Nepenthes gracilis]|uniref:SANT domain-containing protein n=1 Tax=Nepenthes gracilis TaxID=150966 RepID=A0AAD3SH75_NEPGR|nr:hypothetical protein Nepgr_012373 [Nepenthes gracilis]